MQDDTPWLLQGSAYGPALFPAMFRAVARVATLALPVALIACGGIHSVAQAQAALPRARRQSSLTQSSGSSQDSRAHWPPR